MITDRQANTVYFSQHLATNSEYLPAWQRIEAILKKHQVNYKFLQGTKDVWARDYMPIQVSEDKLVQFRYEPSYIKKLGIEHLQSDPREVLAANGFKAIYSNLNVDGGNIIRWTDKVIMTRRVVDENLEKDERDIVRELEMLLEVPVHFVKDINTDDTGHVDGMLRFVNGNTLLVNQLDGDLKYVRDGFQKMISQTRLDYLEMPWFIFKDKHNSGTAVGVYVNYLEVGNLIIFPVFEVPGNKDAEALKVIESAFPEKKIEPVNINEIAAQGGLMNCISWTIRE